MRIILFFLVIAFPIVSFSQEKFRLYNHKNKATLYHEAYSVALEMQEIDKILDSNDQSLQYESHFQMAHLKNPTSKIESLKKLLVDTEIDKVLLDNICVECYANEYNEQIRKAKNVIQTQVITDSIKRLTDSIKSQQTKERTPRIVELKGYDGFKFHLDGMAPDFLRGCITPFIGVDYGFASSRFAVYIISNTDYTIDEECSNESGNSIVHCFVPKIQIGNIKERLKVTYTVIPDKTKISYIPNNTCQILTNVSIEGNTDIVLHIFMQYWQTKVHSSKNIGVIATWQFMGDFISLKKTNKGILRIDITKNPNIRMDYYQMFDIK